MKKCCDNGKCAGFLRFLPPPSGSLAVAGLFIVGLAYAETACPTGMVPYQGPAVTQMENSNGECADLCDTGMRAIMMADGSKRIDLFKTASTARKMVANYGDSICYADVVAGSQEGALNVDINGVVHYVAPSNWKICPPKYTLSYDCGDADSGTIDANQSQEIIYGQVYSPGYPETTCVKEGHYISSWLINGTKVVPRSYSVWTMDADQVAVAQWSKRRIHATYLCNICEYPFVYRLAGHNSDVSAQSLFGSTTTLAAPNTSGGTPCGVPAGAVFQGYDVYNAYTNEATGEFVSALDANGNAQTMTFEWKYPFILSFRARWNWDYSAQSNTVNFSCGTDTDVSGVAPAAQTVKYGHLFAFGMDTGSCIRPGYFAGDWSISDGTNKRTGSRYYWARWGLSSDATATVGWNKRTFGVAYVCSDGGTSSNYATVVYQNTFTPAADKCTPPEGKVLAGYKVYNGFGEDTNTVVNAGEGFVYNYLTNISLHAIWADAE